MAAYQGYSFIMLTGIQAISNWIEIEIKTRIQPWFLTAFTRYYHFSPEILSLLCWYCHFWHWHFSPVIVTFPSLICHCWHFSLIIALQVYTHLNVEPITQLLARPVSEDEFDELAYLSKGNITHMPVSMTTSIHFVPLFFLVNQEISYYYLKLTHESLCGYSIMLWCNLFVKLIWYPIL